MFSAVHRTILAGAAGLAAVIATATPALASDKFLTIRGTAVCDSAAGEFAVTWTVTNPNEIAGTVGDVRAYPAARSIVGVPERLEAHKTAVATQRLRYTEYTGQIQLDVTWDDGEVVHDYNWPIFIKMGCWPQ
jgi:hypothetical protein